MLGERGRTRKVWLAVLTAALAGSAWPASAAIGTQAGTPVDCLVPGIDDRCEKWAQRYTEGSGDAPFGRHTSDRVAAGALNHDGTRAFTVGHRVDFPRTVKNEMQTVAYNVVTGEKMWVAHEAGPSEEWHAMSRAVALSSDERTVYVVGTLILESEKKQDVLVAAYDAATGVRLWRTSYDGPAGGTDDAFAVAASPSGDGLYVAASVQVSDHPVSMNGYSPLYMTRGFMAAGLEVDVDSALLTFDGSTGDLIDEARQGGSPFLVDGNPRGSWDVATDIEVSPDGRRVVMAGLSDGRETYKTGRPHSTVTVWDATNGEADTWRLGWVREVAGIPLGLGLLPAQGTVAFAGAYGEGGTEYNPYAVLGLDAATGAQRWETRFALGGIPSQLEYPRRLLADPARGLIHLPGISRYSTSNTGTMGVLALRAADGGVAWRTRLRDRRSEATIIFNYDEDEMPVGAVDPASGHVQVTSVREGKLATFSLNGSTGAQRWAGLFEEPVRPGTRLEQSGYDWPADMEAAAGRTVIFGTSYIPYRDSCTSGIFTLPCSRDDFLTIAYEV